MSGSSLLLAAVAEHLLPLEDHLVELLQAGLQPLAVQRRAALGVVQRGRAQLMDGQGLLHLKHQTRERGQHAASMWFVQECIQFECCKTFLVDRATSEHPNPSHSLCTSTAMLPQ